MQPTTNATSPSVSCSGLQGRPPHYLERPTTITCEKVGSQRSKSVFVITMGQPTPFSEAFLQKARNEIRRKDCGLTTITLGSNPDEAKAALEHAFPKNAIVYLVNTNAKREEVEEIWSALRSRHITIACNTPLNPETQLGVLESLSFLIKPFPGDPRMNVGPINVPPRQAPRLSRYEREYPTKPRSPEQYPHPAVPSLQDHFFRMSDVDLYPDSDLN